jgi:hypothetical protein
MKCDTDSLAWNASAVPLPWLLLDYGKITVDFQLLTTSGVVNTQGKWQVAAI